MKIIIIKTLKLIENYDFRYQRILAKYKKLKIITKHFLNLIKNIFNICGSNHDFSHCAYENYNILSSVCELRNIIFIFYVTFVMLYMYILY